MSARAREREQECIRGESAQGVSVHKEDFTLRVWSVPLSPGHYARLPETSSDLVTASEAFLYDAYKRYTGIPRLNELDIQP